MGNPSIVFGPAGAGSDSVPFLLLQIDAEPTTEARRIMARGATDGTTIQAIEFSVGRLGYNPNDFLAALPVNPDAEALDDQSFGPKLIDRVERPNDQAISCYCVLEPAESNLTIGEVAIWGIVQNSPGDPPDGTKVILAISHFPILCKNSSMQYALRVTIQA
jgi:hypothetical protein